MNRITLLATVMALGAVGLAWTAGAARSAPDPYTVFANAREYWLTQRYPRELHYVIAVDVTEGGAERVEHYDASYDALHDVIDVDPLSDYQRAHPVRVSGMNFGILGIPLNKPLPAVDFIGVPYLAPTYSFGMAPFVPAPTPTPFNSAALVAQIREEFHDPDPRRSVAPSPTPNDAMREIATVVARNRDYAISMAGIENVDGHACYHLTLTPLRDPSRFRIREAWIDEQTYAPWQLLDASNFVGGPGSNVAWKIRFADVSGAHVIAEEDAQKPIAASGEIYTKTSIWFENVHAIDASAAHTQIVQKVGKPLTEPPWPGGGNGP